MLDYNTMSYQEGRVLLKQAEDEGWMGKLYEGAKTGIKGLADSAGKTFGNAASSAASSGIGDKLKGLWDNDSVRYGLMGAGGGAALGGLSSLFQDEEERSPVSRMLTGGLLGGMGGAAYGAINQQVKGPGIDEHVKEKLIAAAAKHHKEKNLWRETGHGSPPEPGKSGEPVKPDISKMTSKEIEEAYPDVGKPYTERERIVDAWRAKGEHGIPTGEAAPGHGLYQGALEATGVPAGLQNIQDYAAGRPLHKWDTGISAAQLAALPAAEATMRLAPNTRVGRGLNWWVHGNNAPTPEALTARGQQSGARQAALTAQTQLDALRQSSTPRQHIATHELALAAARRAHAAAPTPDTAAAVTLRQRLLNDLRAPSGTPASLATATTNVADANTALNRINETAGRVARTGGRIRATLGRGSIAIAPAVAGKIIDSLIPRESALAAAEQRSRAFAASEGLD